ncbi:polysaccharide deacetylase family protein [Guptibacillus hwajinpoensis]|uniref:polysaccharide deacetylase family protein n=1 Tax=Guptibacillus hwajinpoensis TaxID=208199 RepID=UPI00384D21C2
MIRRLPFKRIKWPGWVVLILLGVFIIIGIGKWTGDSSEEDVKQKEEKEVSNIEVEQDTENTDRYTMLINTPIIENSTLKKSIHEWIAKQKESFLSEVKSQKDVLGASNRAHLTIQVNVKKGAEDTTSLIFNSYRLVDSIYGETHVKTFSIDSSHNILQLTDVLTTSEKTLDEVRSNIKGQLKKDDVIKNNLIDKKVNEALKDPNSWNWLVTQSALTLYFEKSSITEGDTGTLEVEVPFKEKISTMKDEKDNGEKYVALTFDDGPSMQVTPRVLKILKQHDAKATFFMLGSQVEKYPSIAERVANSGHEIGNHTEHHMDLTKVGKPQMVQEIQSSNQKIQDATGQSPTLIRPPYGAINSKVEKVARDNGSSLILWSVDSLDWKSKNAEAINQVVQNEVVSGSIILLHDVHPTTANALPKLLTTLEEEGYQFLTVSQLLSMQEKYTSRTYYGTT